MVPMRIDEKGTWRPIWQDMTMDWLCNSSEGSMNKRAAGVLCGLHIALKIEIVNTEKTKP